MTWAHCSVPQRSHLRMPLRLSTVLWLVCVVITTIPSTADGAADVRQGRLDCDASVERIRALVDSTDMRRGDAPIRALARGAAHRCNDRFASAGQAFLDAVTTAPPRHRRQIVDQITHLTTTPASGNVRSLLSAAQTYNEQGQHRDAIRRLQEAASLDPGNARIYHDLGYTYIELEQFDRAVSALEQGLTIHPVWNRLFRELRFAYIENAAYEDTRRLLRRNVELFGPKPATMQEWAYLEVRLDNVDRARRILDRSIEVNPNFLPHYLMRASITLTSQSPSLSSYCSAYADYATFLTRSEGGTGSLGIANFDVQQARATALERMRRLRDAGSAIPDSCSTGTAPEVE